jgi:peptidyl-prolyl cis-trans isomerase SurA
MRSLLVLLMLAFAVGAQAAVTLVDRIVAVVNKEVITYSELSEAVAAAERQLKRLKTPSPPRSVLERQVLERLILEKAQLQLARDTGLRVDELQVDRAVERIADSNKLTLPDFRKALESDGLSFAAWRGDVRDQMLMSRLREREVDNRITVSDGEVDNFLEQTKGRASLGMEYNLAHILLRVPEQASPERIAEVRRRADKALAEVRAGNAFGQVAASYSDAPDALQGGTLGWRSSDRLPELFSGALAAMNPGEVSDVLRSPAGFHVLKMLERRGVGASQGAVLQTRMRHILVRTNEAVSESDALRRLANLRERIVTGGEDFGALARVYSEDGTAARGGELEWIYAGDTVPEFERAYSALRIGEVSQPVRTQFGFHLIQVLERRSSDLSPERRRLQARQALRDRKSDEAYQEWLRQLRDQTYVDLRLDER